jgi:hypothetical protein
MHALLLEASDVIMLDWVGIASLGWVGQQTVVSGKLYFMLSLADGSHELLLTL